MACNALRCPCCQVLVDTLWDAAGLDTETVTAEVDGLVVRVDVWSIETCFSSNDICNEYRRMVTYGALV